MKAYVLAGGASRRMGSDKARLPLDGWPVAVRLCERLAAVGLEPALVRRVDDGLPWVYPDHRPVRVVWERTDVTRHPLWGVHSALVDAGEAVVVVPCDLPDLSETGLARLLGRGPCVAAGHPLVGVFPHDLDRLTRLIDEEAPARAFAAGLPEVDLPAADLRDRNVWEGPWPLAARLERLAGVRGLVRERVVAGEIARMAARGVVLPEAVLYARSSGGGVR